MSLVVPEIELCGALRFTEEFATAMALIGQRLVDGRPLLTSTVGAGDAKAGFELAADKIRRMNAQLHF